MTGGIPRIPKLCDMIQNILKERNWIINPAECVVYSPAVQGGILSGNAGGVSKDILLLYFIPLS